MYANYYDYVLVAIPIALLTGGLTAFASGLTLTTTVPLGGALACLVIGHALFINSPTHQSVRPVSPSVEPVTDPIPRTEPLAVEN
jgi:hypothetical protein